MPTGWSTDRLDDNARQGVGALGGSPSVAWAGDCSECLRAFGVYGRMGAAGRARGVSWNESYR